MCLLLHLNSQVYCIFVFCLNLSSFEFNKQRLVNCQINISNILYELLQVTSYNEMINNEREKCQVSCQLTSDKRQPSAYYALNLEH
jgi:hypothetical protein